MNYIDLELYRWRYHNTVHIHTIPKIYNFAQYWKEYGAFVSTVPRGVGKTESIIKLVKTLMSKNCSEDIVGEFLIVVPSPIYVRKFLKAQIHPDNIKFASSLRLEGLNLKDTHLFIDEYDYVSKNLLDGILNHPWKSVSMFSTLR